VQLGTHAISGANSEMETHMGTDIRAVQWHLEPHTSLVTPSRSSSVGLVGSGATEAVNNPDAVASINIHQPQGTAKVRYQSKHRHHPQHPHQQFRDQHRHSQEKMYCIVEYCPKKVGADVSKPAQHLVACNYSLF
jgi:hypothetical protein